MTAVQSVFDGDTIQNAKGGKQSRTLGAFYQLPANGLIAFRVGADAIVGPTAPRSFNEAYEMAWACLTGILADEGNGGNGFTQLSRAIFALSLVIELFERVDASKSRTPGWHGMVRVAQVMEIGAKKYGRGNWRKIEYWSQIDHAVQHFIAFECGDETAYKSEYAERYGYTGDHAICNLWNALCRLVFAAEVFDSAFRFTDDSDLSMVAKQ